MPDPSKHCAHTCVGLEAANPKDERQGDWQLVARHCWIRPETSSKKSNGNGGKPNAGPQRFAGRVIEICGEDVNPPNSPQKINDPPSALLD